MNDMSRAVRGMEAATVADWARSAGDRAAAPWLRWTGPILSIAIIFVVARFLGRADLASLGQLLPNLGVRRELLLPGVEVPKRPADLVG